MLKDSLVVVPFNLPWDWSTDYTNQTAYELGKKNIVVCYMWSEFLSIKEYFVKGRIPILIKKYKENIFIFYPILLIPFRRFPVVVLLNERLNIILLKIFIAVLEINKKFSKKVLWIFDPQTENLLHLFKGKWKTLYDCVDFYGGAVKNTAVSNYIFEKEKLLLNHVDLVVANSIVLQKHLMTMRKDIKLVPQGFRYESFKKSLAHKTTVPVIKKKNRPLIGYVGAVNARIDYKLLLKLVKKLPECDFILWGPLLQKSEFTYKQKKYLERLDGFKNFIRGESDKNEIPSIIKQFDVAMVPYDATNDFNKNCYPMKIFEYFYLGKPVVSTEITELTRFPELVKISNDANGWEKAILTLINNKWPSRLKNIARNYSIGNSWENKIDQISSYL